MFRGYRIRKRYKNFTNGLKVNRDDEFDSDEEDFDMDFGGGLEEFTKKLEIPQQMMNALVGGMMGGGHAPPGNLPPMESIPEEKHERRARPIPKNQENDIFSNFDRQNPQMGQANHEKENLRK